MPWLHNLDPVAFEVGPLAMTWYGLMYLVGYAGALALGFGRWRQGRLRVDATAFADLYFVAMLGVILGARLGHVLFYAPRAWLDDPLLVLRMWEGGMSFHGGVLGVALAVWAWSRRHRIAFGDALDFLVPTAPLAIACGRLGNFINGELWGTPTSLPWGVLFPQALAYEGIPREALPALHATGALAAHARHPTQLYELLLEDLVLFAILWRYSAVQRPRWAVSGLFAPLYAAFRLPLEFLRAYEPGVGPVAFGWLSAGQALCLPMLVVGGVLVAMAARRTPGRY